MAITIDENVLKVKLAKYASRYDTKKKTKICIKIHKICIKNT